MISVMETWYLKPEHTDKALELMQQMDDLVGPQAHDHPGWCGHAHFYQDSDNPSRVIMMYPWKSRELHNDISDKEKNLLQDFMQQYCSRPREIQHFDELEVEVEGDHHHHHHH